MGELMFVAWESLAFLDKNKKIKKYIWLYIDIAPPIASRQNSAYPLFHGESGGQTFFKFYYIFLVKKSNGRTASILFKMSVL